MSTYKIKKSVPMLIVLILFGSMMIFSSSAIAGASTGLSLCIELVVPTLLPFFVLSNLLCLLGFPSYLGRSISPITIPLFGVSGDGMAAFILGITGGYPLGASAVSQMYTAENISRDDAHKLLLFCNNTGPAFIIGMAGISIFRSASIGLLLYVVHIVSALIIALLLCRNTNSARAPRLHISALPLSSAITLSMRRAIVSAAMISGFVIFFSMLTALLSDMGVFTAVTGFIYNHSPMSIGQCDAIVLGIVELSSGITALSGFEVSAGNLAVTAFILGFGGICVLFQTCAVLAETDLSMSYCVIGKILHGVLSAGMVYLVYSLV